MNSIVYLTIMRSLASSSVATDGNVNARSHIACFTSKNLLGDGIIKQK